MLSKRTYSPRVLSSALGLVSLCGCSLQDYDYLGAENKPAETVSSETSPDETSTMSTSVEESTEAPDASVTSSEESTSSEVSSTMVTSEPDASVTSAESTMDTSSSAEPMPTTTPDPTSTEVLPPLVVEGNLLSNSSFEDSVVPWTGLGGAVLVVSTEQAHTGEASMLVGGRNTATWEGPSIALLAVLDPAKSYVMKGWVRTDSANGSGFHIVAKAPCITEAGVIDTTDNTNYIQLASAIAKAQTWTEVRTSAFTMRDCELAEYTVYFEGPAVGENFFVDDVSIVEVTP